MSGPLGRGRAAVGAGGAWALGGIANHRHWVPDVPRGADDCRGQGGQAAENWATLRRIVRNLFRRATPTKTGPQAKPLKTAGDHADLQSLLKS